MLRSEFVFFGPWNISLALIHGSKHKHFAISLFISSQVLKPDFFVTRATSKTFKIFWLIHNHFSPEGHLTFMDNPIIRIATKFQYKLTLLRTLAVMDSDTISWSQGGPQRKSYRYTSLQRSSQLNDITCLVNAFLRLVRSRLYICFWLVPRQVRPSPV